MGCHFLPQAIFLTQGSNLCLLRFLRWRENYLPLCHLGSPHPTPAAAEGQRASHRWARRTGTGSSGACMVCSTLLQPRPGRTLKWVAMCCQPPPGVFLNLGTEPVSHVSYTGRWVLFVCLFVFFLTISATWEAQRSSGIRGNLLTVFLSI